MHQKKINKAVRTLLSQKTRIGGVSVSNTELVAEIKTFHQEQAQRAFICGYEAGLAAHQAALDNAPAPLTAQEALKIHCPYLLTNK